MQIYLELLNPIGIKIKTLKLMWKLSKENKQHRAPDLEIIPFLILDPRQQSLIRRSPSTEASSFNKPLTI